MAILFDESFQYGLPKTWTKYDGRHPGGNTITTWRSAQVVHVPIRPGIARGRVDLIGQWKNGELVAGGIGRWAGSQLEVNTGFEVTMRANAGNLAICALLMGNGTWRSTLSRTAVATERTLRPDFTTEPGGQTIIKQMG
jgi:hypothetical protein